MCVKREYLPEGNRVSYSIFMTSACHYFVLFIILRRKLSLEAKDLSLWNKYYVVHVERAMMKRIEEIKRKLVKLKPFLKEEYKVTAIGVFGSYVKGEEKRGSDLDILVEFDESAGLSLLDFIGLENYLSEVLAVKVDLVEKSALKPRIGKRILEEVVNL